MLAWAHRFADTAYREEEPGLLFWGFVILGSICKLGFLGCVPFLLRRIFIAMHQDGRRTLLCAASWALASAILITIFTVFHDTLTAILNTEAVRFYPLTGPSTEIDGYYIGREAWLTRWHSGQILALEVGFALAIIALLASIGYGWKNRAVDRVGYPKTITTGLALLVVCIAWPQMFQLINWDYDVFVGAMVSGSVALELVVFPPLVVEPSSQITFIVFVAFTLSTYAALHRVLPKLGG